jgi:phospholipid-binding lipoprotein MlaA
MPLPRPLAAVATLALLLPAACAQSPAAPQSRAAPPAGTSSVAEAAPAPVQSVAATTPGDPLESINRAFFDFNIAFDDAILRPVALGYRHVFHPWVRERIRNVVNNAHELRHSGNALLQGEPIAAGTSLMRFVVNTTLGLGGMFDLQSIGGPPHDPRDFGQTLYRWGVPDGPFLMVPVLGPTNVRDLTGRVADGFMNPVSWYMPLAGNMSRGVMEGLDLRERNIESLDALRAESLDFYARVRSIAQQRRNAELGRSGSEPGGIDVLDDPDAPAPLGAPISEAPRPAPRQLVAARPPRQAGQATRRPARVQVQAQRPAAARKVTATAQRRGTSPAPAAPLRTASLPLSR